ncbi:hypothetical protein EY919_22045 [Citrobacter braakii]|nr:hypothetical protein EY919_22045 [Citrobacter braakii]
MRRLLRGKIESAHYVRKWTRAVCYLRLRIRSGKGFVPGIALQEECSIDSIFPLFFPRGLNGQYYSRRNSTTGGGRQCVHPSDFRGESHCPSFVWLCG